MVLMPVSRPIRPTQEEQSSLQRLDASNVEWEIENSSCKQAVPSFSAAAWPTKGLFGVGPHRQRSTAHDETKRRSRGGVGKGLKKKMVEQRGGRLL
jgi:hypothetical protein